MDDLTSKLSELLSDPAAAEKLKQAADSLLGGQAASDGGTGGADAAAIARLLSALNAPDDERAALLTALRPHLSPERRERVDRAVKLLKLARVLPLIQKEGLIEL